MSTPVDSLAPLADILGSEDGVAIRASFCYDKTNIPKNRKLEQVRSRRNREKRSKNSSETRDALLSAARLRFAVDGFQATNLRSIASDAGVDVALISRYFGSKEGLFQAVVGFERKRIADVTQNAGPELVRRLIENVLADPLGEKGDLLSTLLRSSNHPPAVEYMASVLETLESDLAKLSAQPDKKIRASLVTALLLGIALQRRVLRKLPLSEVSVHRLTPIFSRAISILLDGAENPEGSSTSKRQRRGYLFVG